MNITKLSRSRILVTATRWTVPRDYFDPLYNYLVHGYEPGSFWSAVLANDFMRAVSSSHPGNDIGALKNTVGWIRDSFPEESFGNHHVVSAWLDLTPHTRRRILESNQLIYTEQEEIILGLRGAKPLPEPVMW